MIRDGGLTAKENVQGFVVRRGGGVGFQVYVQNGDAVACTCPAWRFQRGHDWDKRPCEHMAFAAQVPVEVA